MCVLCGDTRTVNYESWIQFKNSCMMFIMIMNSLSTAEHIDIRFKKNVATTIIFQTKKLKLIHLQILAQQKRFLTGSISSSRRVLVIMSEGAVTYQGHLKSL